MKDITHEASRENRPPLSSGLRAWVRIFEAGTSSARLCRRLAHPALSLLLLGLIACRQDLSPTADNNIHFGVSAPLTGDNAQYARLWRQGFDLALEDIKDQGGVRGRQVVLDWEDSESDPKQPVNIAQRFVDDPRISRGNGRFFVAVFDGRQPCL